MERSRCLKDSLSRALFLALERALTLRLLTKKRGLSEERKPGNPQVLQQKRLTNLYNVMGGLALYDTLSFMLRQEKGQQRPLIHIFHWGLYFAPQSAYFFLSSASSFCCRFVLVTQIPCLSFLISCSLLSRSLSIVYMVTWFNYFLEGRSVYCLPSFSYFSPIPLCVFCLYSRSKDRLICSGLKLGLR